MTIGHWVTRETVPTRCLWKKHHDPTRACGGLSPRTRNAQRTSRNHEGLLILSMMAPSFRSNSSTSRGICKRTDRDEAKVTGLKEAYDVHGSLT